MTNKVYVLVVNDLNHGENTVLLSYSNEGILKLKEEYLETFKKEYKISDSENIEEALELCSISFEDIYQLTITE